MRLGTSMEESLSRLSCLALEVCLIPLRVLGDTFSVLAIPSPQAVA